MAGAMPPQGGYPPQTPPGGYAAQPTAQPYEPPATRDDVRALKRWIAVAVAWAVAATAVALIALLDGSGTDAERQADDTASRVSDLQRTIDRRLDTLESRVEGLPQAADQSRLNDRLARVEDQAAKAAQDAKSANDKLSDFEDRLRTVEDQSADAGSPRTSPDQP